LLTNSPNPPENLNSIISYRSSSTLQKFIQVQQTKIELLAFCKHFKPYFLGLIGTIVAAHFPPAERFVERIACVLVMALASERMHTMRAAERGVFTFLMGNQPPTSKRRSAIIDIKTAATFSSCPL
jgi:hypothetical protein